MEALVEYKQQLADAEERLVAHQSRLAEVKRRHEDAMAELTDAREALKNIQTRIHSSEYPAYCEMESTYIIQIMALKQKVKEHSNK